MPHSDKSTRTPEGVRACPYCGRTLRGDQRACPAHADLLRLEAFDDRVTLTDDEADT